MCVHVTVIMRTTLRRNGALISHRRSKKTTTRISGSREAYSRYINACNSLSSEGLLSRYEPREIEATTTGLYNRYSVRENHIIAIFSLFARKFAITINFANNMTSIKLQFIIRKIYMILIIIVLIFYFLFLYEFFLI